MPSIFQEYFVVFRSLDKFTLLLPKRYPLAVAEAETALPN